MSVVLVLNADCGPLHRVSLRHAIRMLFRQVAVVHEAQPDARIGIYPIPTVVRLVSYVVTRWRQRMGRHGRGLRPLQQPQGRPHAVRSPHAAAGEAVRPGVGVGVTAADGLCSVVRPGTGALLC